MVKKKKSKSKGHKVSKKSKSKGGGRSPSGKSKLSKVKKLIRLSKFGGHTKRKHK